AGTSAVGALPHFPAMHATVGSHLVPQPPQLLGSLVESMHVGVGPPSPPGASQTLSVPGAHAQPPSCRMVKLLYGHRPALAETTEPALLPLEPALALASGDEPPPVPELPPLLSYGE